MSWEDALRVGLVVIGSLGGAGAIVFGFSGFLGRLWADRVVERQRVKSDEGLTKLRVEVEGGLRRLDAALGHRSFLLQRVAEMELEGLRDCWQKARACVPAVNGPRAMHSGSDLADLNARTDQLRIAHNALMESLGQHEPFLPDKIAQLLEQVRRTASLELLQIQSRKPFEGDWWEKGEKNQATTRCLTDELRVLVKTRFAELTTDKS